FDIGAEASTGPVTVTTTLPDGMTSPGGPDCAETAPSVVTCSFEAPPPGTVGEGMRAPFQLEFHVAIPTGAEGGAEAGVEVSGGGASAVARTTVPLHFGSSSPGLGISNFDGWASDAD